MSSPCAAGAAVLARQYLADGWYPTGSKVPANGFNPSSALLKALLINSADADISGYVIPNNYVGWGRVDLDNALYFQGDARKLLLADVATGINTGETHNYQFKVVNITEPLKVTLAWTDYPASTAAAKALVNDLDLLVTTLNGDEYKGNVYSGGTSQTGGEFDDRNVEENVRIEMPSVGGWAVEIRGRNIPQGPQPYALVITGGVDSLATGMKESERSSDSFYNLFPSDPNPFSQVAQIDYQLPKKGSIELSVYNILGAKVRTLVDEVKEPGRYNLYWDGRDDLGRALPAGVYFYRLKADGFDKIQKVVMVH
jgi:hypothetical protein